MRVANKVLEGIDNDIKVLREKIQNKAKNNEFAQEQLQIE